MKVVIDGVEYVPDKSIPKDARKLIVVELMIRDVFRIIKDIHEDAVNRHEWTRKDFSVATVEAETSLRDAEFLMRKIKEIPMASKYLEEA